MFDDRIPISNSHLFDGYYPSGARSRPKIWNAIARKRLDAPWSSWRPQFADALVFNKFNGFFFEP